MLISNALRPIFERAKKEGVSMRDLRSVMYDAVNETVLSILVGWDEPSPPVEPLAEPISIIQSGLIGELFRAPLKVENVDPHDMIERYMEKTPTVTFRKEGDDIANELERH
jgi:hypothetical protein